MSLRITLISNAMTQAMHSVAFPSDEPLDQRAEEKVRCAAVGFRSTRIAYTSPALRARQTACCLGLDAQVEADLRDCDHGRWTGRSLNDVQSEEPDALATWITDPYSAPHGGEPLVAVVQRVGAWLSTRTQTGRIVAVTHSTIVRAALLHVLGAQVDSFWRIDVEPLRRTELSHDGRRWTLRSLNSVLAL